MKTATIVMTYHNRRELLLRTLKTVAASKYASTTKVIIVDDGSDEDQRIEDLETPLIRVIRLEKKDKWYTNPCVPFNIGFKEVDTDITIIQNPECIHIGDVIACVVEHLQPNQYHSYSCYSFTKALNEKLDTFDYTSLEEFNKNIHLEQRPVYSDGDTGWYNHPQFRPLGYHFCSAIHTADLKDLGGFDKRFAKGIAYDDDEFFIRINRKGMNVFIVLNPVVIHQWHYTYSAWEGINAGELVTRNRNLLEQIRRETGWRANENI